MMKSTIRFDRKKAAFFQETRFLRALATAIVLVVMALMIGGCGFYHGQGETAAERSRRHYRTMRLNVNQMSEDIDKVLLLDRPSRLTEKRVP